MTRTHQSSSSFTVALTSPPLASCNSLVVAVFLVFAVHLLPTSTSSPALASLLKWNAIQFRIQFQYAPQGPFVATFKVLVSV